MTPNLKLQEAINDVVNYFNSEHGKPHPIDGSLDTLISALSKITCSKCKELETIIEAWHTAFGTTQLTHALDRLETAERQIPKPEGIELAMNDERNRLALKVDILTRDNKNLYRALEVAHQKEMSLLGGQIPKPEGNGLLQQKYVARCKELEAKVAEYRVALEKIFDFKRWALSEGVSYFLQLEKVIDIASKALKVTKE